MDYEKWMNRAKEIIEKEVEYNKRFEWKIFVEKYRNLKVATVKEAQ